MGWYDAIKVAGDAIDALRNAELTGLLANVRMEGAKLAEENARLREELLALRETARLRGTMVFRDNVFWQVEGGTTHGPLCPKCWPADGKIGAETVGFAQFARRISIGRAEVATRMTTSSLLAIPCRRHAAS